MFTIEYTPEQAEISLAKQKGLDGTPIPDGNYEALIFWGEERVAKTGTKFVTIYFKIRDDVDQLGKSRLIEYKMYQSKTTGQYQSWQVINLLKAVNEPNKKFNSLADYLLFLKGKNVEITIETETTEWRGRKREEIKVKWINPTKNKKGT